jgi:hypothetical protein
LQCVYFPADLALGPSLSSRGVRRRSRTPDIVVVVATTRREGTRDPAIATRPTTASTVVAGAATPLGAATTPRSNICRRLRGVVLTWLFVKMELIAQHLREELGQQDRFNAGDDGGHQLVVDFLIQTGEYVGHELFIAKSLTRGRHFIDEVLHLGVVFRH